MPETRAAAAVPVAAAAVPVAAAVISHGWVLEGQRRVSIHVSVFVVTGFTGKCIQGVLCA